MELTETDLDALRRAIEWGHRYQRGKRIVVVSLPLPPEGSKEWIEVATRLAAMAQAVTLGLKPWECEPSHTHDDGVIDDDCYCRRSNEVALRRRMIALGISVYEPNPPVALERAERKRRQNGSDVRVERAPPQ